jgi:hypothetical protein
MKVKKSVPSTYPSVMIGVTENTSHSTTKMYRGTIILIQYSFSCKSQIKYFRIQTFYGHFSYFGMCNSCSKFVRTFQLHPLSLQQPDHFRYIQLASGKIANSALIRFFVKCFNCWRHGIQNRSYGLIIFL